MVNYAPEQGIAMWFSKREHREVRDEPIKDPIGDIEAAQVIREICRSAADSVERVDGSPMVRAPNADRRVGTSKRASAIGAPPKGPWKSP